jgi:hypothetical protein
LSPLLEATSFPSALKIAASSVSKLSASEVAPNCLPLSASQRVRASAPAPAETRLRPPSVKATATTGSACPASVRVSRPRMASQILIVRSLLPDARRLPS